MSLIGVVGAGTMGRGIAAAFAATGRPVIVVEPEPAAAASAAAEFDTLPDGGEIRVVAEVTELCDATLVVEATPEEPAIKIAVLCAIEDVVTSTALLATNTSSLSIDRLGECLRVADRFAGMHFFNPVDRSALIELVRGVRSSDATMRSLHEVVALLGKEAIEVNDSPGFATSRLGVAVGLEAIRMLEEGVASAEDIDRAMVLGYRFPMGPLRLTDLVGLDVRAAIAANLHAAFGERFQPPSLLLDKVAAGELGRKTGRGFFTWT